MQVTKTRKHRFFKLGGNLLVGALLSAKTRLIQAWIEIHREDLMADWELAASGQPPPLKLRLCDKRWAMEQVISVCPRDDFHL